MNEKKQNANATKPKKEVADFTQPLNATKTESSIMPDGRETEESSTESLKALQKEVAEKEEQINKQLEILWASGTKQMLGDHTTPFVATPTNSTKTIPQQNSVPLEPVSPTKQQTQQKIEVNIEHELVSLEKDNQETVKKITQKRNGSSTKKKKALP